jgi:hypothetical protein
MMMAFPLRTPFYIRSFLTVIIPTHKRLYSIKKELLKKEFLKLKIKSKGKGYKIKSHKKKNGS